MIFANSKNSKLEISQVYDIRLQIRKVVATSRAGHVPTFLKSFRSVLERGPSDKSFRSRSFFVVSFLYVPFRSE